MIIMMMDHNLHQVVSWIMFPFVRFWGLRHFLLSPFEDIPLTWETCCVLPSGAAAAMPVGGGAPMASVQVAPQISKASRVQIATPGSGACTTQLSGWNSQERETRDIMDKCYGHI